MRFSLFYNFDILPGKSVPELYREVEAQAQAADALGFDAIWLAEHHFELYGRMPDPLLYLARISSITKQIDLGTAVIEAPYYNPLRLAEDAGVLDVLSGGRLRLGVGSGATKKTQEFVPFGISIEQKSARTLEVIKILQQAFDNGHIDFAGDYYHYKDVEIQPRSIQSASQLLWLAAGSGTPEVAAQIGCQLLIPRPGSSSLHLQLINRYREALVAVLSSESRKDLDESGLPPGKVYSPNPNRSSGNAPGTKSGFVSLLRFIHVAETEREAQEQTRRTVARYAKYDYGIDWDGRIDTQEYVDILHRLNAVIGTPDQVIAQLQQWQQETPFEEIMCQTHSAGILHEDSLRSIQLLGREVLPRLQS